MKKQTKNKRLSFNKFKIASISKYGKSKVFGGTGNTKPSDETGSDTNRPKETIMPQSGLFCIGEEEDEDDTN